MNIPKCTKGHGPMKLVHITQGEGKEEKSLGYAWFCVNDDESKPEYCDECEDYVEADQNGPERMIMEQPS